MQGIVKRALAALMALILIAGQIQPAFASITASSDSSSEPQDSCAQSEVEPEVEPEEEEGAVPEVLEPESEPETEVSAPAEASVQTPAPTRQLMEQPASTQAPVEEPTQAPTEQPVQTPEAVPTEAVTEAAEEEPELVEQTIPADTPGDGEVTLTGQLPEDAQVSVSEAEREARRAGLEHILCAYDITINDGWQPEAAVEVSIVNEDISPYVRVFHIDDDGTAEEVEITRAESGEVVFDAEGFSIYVVTEDTFRRIYEFMDYKFEAWMPYEFALSLPEDPDDPHQGVFESNRQILRNGDELVIPSLPNKDGMRFIGWYTSPTSDLNQAVPERGGVKNDINANSIVTLYARYGNPVTVTFYNRPQGSAGNQIFSTRTVILSRGEDSAVVDLSEELTPVPPEAGQGFLGWREAGASEIISADAYTVRDHVSLYPVFAARYQITFAQTGEDQSYVAPLWVDPAGVSGTLSAAVPVRPGYAFAGWSCGGAELTDGDNRLLEQDAAFPGGTLQAGVLTLTGDITLTPRWTPGESSYDVIIWQEKTSDTSRLTLTEQGWQVPQSQREYDHLCTLTVNDTSGDLVTGAALEQQWAGLGGQDAVTLDGRPFDFSALTYSAMTDGSGNPLGSGYGFTVAGDGSSVVHVYYDRALVLLHFTFPEDVTETHAVAQPEYYPAVYGSTSVNQSAVTAVHSAKFPEDFTLAGLSGGSISDGKRGEESAFWPDSYTVTDLRYTLTARTMTYSNGSWNETASTSTEQSEDAHIFTTTWEDENGAEVYFEDTFTRSMTLTPTHVPDRLHNNVAGATVNYYKETEQSPYPATAVYSGTAAVSFTAIEGQDMMVGNPFSGFELDYFTYTDGKGTPIRRESDATFAQRLLATGNFQDVKVYCRRSTHQIVFHNGDTTLPDTVGVKYGLSLATAYIKQRTPTPDLPAELAGSEDHVEFVGWFLDPELTVYLDFAGLKAGARARLMLQYDHIQEIVSVYDYRPASGQTVAALRMPDGDLHLYAGWVHRRLLVELEPEGGELNSQTPTFFWKDCDETLPVYPVTRDYTLWQQGQEPYVYHIHTYDQSVKDNDTTDRTACYLPAGAESEGTRYGYDPGKYRFLGWFSVETGENGTEVLRPYDHETKLSGDVKLRAQWSRTGVYRLRYDPGEHGTLTGAALTAQYRDHASVPLNGDITPEGGYVFTGWKIRRPDGSGELLDTRYTSGDVLVINSDWAELTEDEYAGEPRGVITLVAQYSRLAGTSITYYANGGAYVGPSEEAQAADPALAQMLRDRLTTDYGEFAAHHYIYDASGAIIGYTVSGIEQNANLTTEDGTAFQRSGYKLMGWSYTADGSVDLELNTGGFRAPSDPEGLGHVLYAVWKPEITITFDLQGGTWNSENGSEYTSEDGNLWTYGAGKGEQAPIPAAPTREGYAFKGWSRGTAGNTMLSQMPTVTGKMTIYAIWTTDVVLRYELNGGSWPSTGDLYILDKTGMGKSVTAGSVTYLTSVTPVWEDGYLFYKWEQGSYQYASGEKFRTGAEQAGKVVTFTALWSGGIPVVDVLVAADDSLTLEDTGSMLGATEDTTSLTASREIEDYQFLYAVYDELPDEKADIAEHYRVTAIEYLGENAYQVTLANGQTKVHYPDSTEKLQAIYIQNRTLKLYVRRMNTKDDGQENMNLTLSSMSTSSYTVAEPYNTVVVGSVNLKKTLPDPNKYKVGGSYGSYSYAIGREGAEDINDIDTMTKGDLWIQQTLNGFAFSVNGQEWKELNREEGNGKDAAIYIIYDKRVETLTTITHNVTGLKSDKEKLITYQVYVKGRWGFNVSYGGTLTYFIHKPDDPSEELNSYTVVLADKDQLVLPLHIDWLNTWGEDGKQYYTPGDYFYDMFGNDYRTPTNTTAMRSEYKRVWQEVEMRRTSELPFTDGTFSVAINMSKGSAFNGYDKTDFLWLKQLGISAVNKVTYTHSFTYTRTSLNVPVHVLEQTRDGYVLRDEEWLDGGSRTISVNATGVTVNDALASTMVTTPEDYALQQVCYGLSTKDMEGEDQEATLKLASDSGDTTLLHVYDYESADSTTRALVPDGSAVYLVYYRHSSTQVPVEYVKSDAAGVYSPMDLSGYNLSNPVATVTDTEDVSIRSLPEVLAINAVVGRLDAIYLTGRLFLTDQKGNILSTFEPDAGGNWSAGRDVVLRNTGAGLTYTADDGSEQSEANVRVWVEVASNQSLRIIGRLFQRGSWSRNTGIIPYLPKDDSGFILANGTYESVEEAFPGFVDYIPYASDPEVEYHSASRGTDSADHDIASVAYVTGGDGYRYWYYKATADGEPQRMEQILYADYISLTSPVNLRYVVDTGSGYAEVEDLEPEVLHTLTVDRTGLEVREALEDSLTAIDQTSNLYRTTGTLLLGSEDLSRVFLTTTGGTLHIRDGMEGLTYTAPEDSGTLTGADYPDVYVLLRPVVTLKLSKRIEDTSGYAVWSDKFTFTILLSDSSFTSVLRADFTSDSTLAHAVEADSSGHMMVSFVDGIATVKLQHGQTISIPDLPRGATVTVLETEHFRYTSVFQTRQGAKVIAGGSVEMDYPTAITCTNTSREIAATGKDYRDGGAYGLLLCGAGAYGLYLLLKRRRG